MASFGRVQEIAHDIGANGRFALRVTASDVELRPAADGKARVRVEFDIRATDDAEADSTFERAHFDVDAGDGYLEVAEPRRGESGGLGSIVRLFGSGSRIDARVVCEVPPSARVSYTGVSADLLVRGMLGTQDYRTVSGDAVLTDVGGPIRVSSVSGDVSLRAVEPVELHANSVSGDVSAFAPRLERTRATTVSGDIELEGDLAEGGEHRFDTVSGDLSLGAVGGLTLEVRGLSSDVSVALPHRSEGPRDRRRYIIGDAGPSVFFSSMSGDVTVGPSRRFQPRPPAPPAPASPAAAPAPPSPPASSETRAPAEEEQLAILRALEAGEIDVEEATRRLAGEAGGG